MRSIVTKSITKEFFFFVAVIERKDGNTIVAFKTDTSADSFLEHASMVTGLHEEIGMKRHDLANGGTHLFSCTDEADQMATIQRLLDAAARHGVDVSLVTKGRSAGFNGGQRAPACN